MEYVDRFVGKKEGDINLFLMNLAKALSFQRDALLIIQSGGD